MVDKLCPICEVPRDYGQGWVFCPHKRVWLKKGYAQCKGFRPKSLQTSSETQEIESK